MCILCHFFRWYCTAHCLSGMLCHISSFFYYSVCSSCLSQCNWNAMVSHFPVSSGSLIHSEVCVFFALYAAFIWEQNNKRCWIFEYYDKWICNCVTCIVAFSICVLWFSLGLYTVSQKSYHLLLFDYLVKCWPILVIFGSVAAENICKQMTYPVYVEEHPTGSVIRFRVRLFCLHCLSQWGWMVF